MLTNKMCFKLMIEDAKRRLWLIGLLMLFFACAYPVAMAMAMVMEDRVMDIEKNGEQLLEDTKEINSSTLGFYKQFLNENHRTAYLFT